MQYSDCFNQFKLLFCYQNMTSKMGSKIVAREIFGLGYGHNFLVLWESLFHLFASNSTTTIRHSCKQTFSRMQLNFSLEMPDFAQKFWVHRSSMSESHWNGKSRMQRLRTWKERRGKSMPPNFTFLMISRQNSPMYKTDSRLKVGHQIKITIIRLKSRSISRPWRLRLKMTPKRDRVVK